MFNLKECFETIAYFMVFCIVEKLLCTAMEIDIPNLCVMIGGLVFTVFYKYWQVVVKSRFYIYSYLIDRCLLSLK